MILQSKNIKKFKAGEKIMKRIAFMIFRNFWVFPYLYIKLVILAKSKTSSDEERYEHLRKITYYANKSGRVHIECYGKENIPKENGYILFPNHQGLYDVLTIIDTHEKPLSVVMKKELEKVPMLSKIFLAMRAHSIDREDIRQSMKVIQQVSEEAAEGKNFVIFAEGTRSKEGNKPGEFKGGSFKSAIKARCPIVPVALVDAFKPFDISSVKKVTVKISYLEPIYYEEYKDMKTTQIANLVKKKITDRIEEVLSM